MARATRILIIGGLAAMLVPSAIAGAQALSSHPAAPGTAEVGRGVGTAPASAHALNGLQVAAQAAPAQTIGKLIERHARSN